VQRAAVMTALGVAAAVALAACGGGSDEPALRTGRQIYVAVCQTCHGRTGGGFVGPSLVDVAERYDVGAQIELVTDGQAAMPGFGNQHRADPDA
jgi:mono/diheme cytochrome c family protein